MQKLRAQNKKLCRVGVAAIAMLMAIDYGPAQAIPPPDFQALYHNGLKLVRIVADEILPDPSLHDPAEDQNNAEVAVLGDIEPPDLGVPRGFVPGQSQELTDLRTERTRTFKNPDGTKTTEIFTAPIHFQDQAGVWREIDSTLEEIQGGYRNKAGPLRYFIGEDISNQGAIVEAPGGYARLRFPGANSSSRYLDGKQLTIKNAYRGIDVQFASLPYSLTLALLITDSISAGSGRFKFELDTNLTPTTGPQDQIELRDAENRVVLVLPQGRAWDSSADPAESESAENTVGVSVSFVDKKRHRHGRIHRHPEFVPDPHPSIHRHPHGNAKGEPGEEGKLILEIDQRWLRDRNRIYPVTVDPVTLWSVRADTFVSSSAPDANYWDFQSNAVPTRKGEWTVVRRVGQHERFGDNRSLFYLTPDDVPAAQLARVVDAQFSVWVYYERQNASLADWMLPIPNWNPYAVTWNTQPEYSPNFRGRATSRDGSWLHVRHELLTAAVQQWLDGSWESHGIALGGSSEDYKLVASAFDDPSRAPRIGITYNSPPDVAMPNAPEDQAVLGTEEPTFTHKPAADPDGDTVYYQIRITTNPDGKTGQVIASPWSSDPNREWKVPRGVLRDGATYYWGVYTSDGTDISPSDVLRPAPPGWLRVFRIESRRLGARPYYAMQSYPVGSRASLAVNAENGNLVASVPGPSYPTATSVFSAGLVYNSQDRIELGLEGRYYQWQETGSRDPDLMFDSQNLRLQRRDQLLNFAWSGKSPGPDLEPNRYAVRWTGYIRVPNDGNTYNLRVVHDDGVRVWIGEPGQAAASQLIVNAWSDGGVRSESSSKPLRGTSSLLGSTYPVVIEYYQAEGTDSTLRLQWHPQGQPQNATPVANLVPRAKRLPQGWQLALDADGPALYIEARASNDAVVHTGAGDTFVYRFDGSRWVPPPEVEKTDLRKSQDGTWTFETDDGTTYFFDASGRPQSVYTPADLGVAKPPFQYLYGSDAFGLRLEKVVDVAGREVIFEYNATSPPSPSAGMLKRIRYFDGEKTELVYGPGGGLIQVIQPGGATVGFSYLADGAIGFARSARSFDENTSYGVDVSYYPASEESRWRPKVKTITGPAASPGEDRPVVTYLYATPSPGRTVLRDPLGNQTTFGFDSAGRHILTRDPTGLESRRSYDFRNNVIEAQGPDGNKRFYSYDHRGRPSEVRGPKERPATGELVRSFVSYDEGIRGLQGVYFRNKRLSGAQVGAPPGPLAARTDPRIDFSWGTGGPIQGGPSDTFSVRWTGELDVPQAGDYRFTAYVDDGIRVYLAGSKVIDAWTDGPPRDIQSSFYALPQGRIPIIVEYYENTGNAVVRLDWEGPGFSRQPIPAERLLPAYGLPTSATSADGTVVKTFYPADPIRGLPIRQEVEVRQPSGALQKLASSVQYDALGRVARATDPNGNVTHFEYWGLSDTASPPSPCVGQTAKQAGLLRRVVPPPGKLPVEAFYDNAGRIVAARFTNTTNEGPTCRSYDARGRLTRVDAPQPFGSPPAVDAAGSVEYSYNGDDALVMADDFRGGKVAQTFDRLGRLSTHTDAAGGTTTYFYDLAGRLIRQTGPAGDQGFAYDSAGKPTRATWGFQGIDPLSVNYSYDWAGRLSEMVRSNGVRTRLRYSGFSEVVTQEDIDSRGSAISGIRYLFDDVGRLFRQMGSAQNLDYIYDEVARLTTVKDGSVERLYTFDANTNRSALAERDVLLRFASDGTPASGRWNYNPINATIESSRGSESPNEDARLVYGPDSLSDFAAEVSIYFVAGAVDAGMDIRWRRGGADRYIIAMRATDTAIHKVRGGSLTTVATVSKQHRVGQGYRLRVEARGREIKVYEDGTLVLSYQDPDGANFAEYQKRGYDQGFIALSSYNTWASFSAFVVTDDKGRTLLRDDFGARTVEGDWRPNGGWLSQLALNPGERHGIPITGTNVSDFDLRFELRFDREPQPSSVDGGVRFRRDPSTGAAYTLALRAQDLALFDTDGTLVRSVARPHKVGSTYAIRVVGRSNRFQIYEDGSLVVDWADLTSPRLSGEIAPYSWTSALSVRRFVVYKPDPRSLVTYDYNSTDQLVRAGECSLASGNVGGEPCIAYDYRGNTVLLRGMRFRYDTSNRLTYQEAIPQVHAPANPLAISPDGRRVVFSSSRDGNQEIYTALVDGTDLRRLTNHPAEDTFPRFSPDGSRIVFVSTRDGNQEIYSMAADGTDVRRLTFDGARDDHPAFSPDGTYLVFVSDRDTAGNTDLYKLSLNPDGSPAGVVRLTATPDAAEAWPVISPDGQKIAFTRCVDIPSPPFAFTCHVATANPDGSGYTVITPPDSFDYLPAWSPDSQSIAFSSGRDGNLEIYLMGADGSNQRRLTNNSASDAAPAFLDGTTLVFVSDRDHPGEGIGELYRIRTDGTEEIRLTQDAMIGSPPSPGPLGQPQPNTPARTTISYDALSRPFIRRTTQGSTVETTVFGYSSPSSVPTYLKNSAGKIIWRTFVAAGLLAYADTRGETPKVSFIHSDKRGDDIAETDAAGQLSRKNTYTEYGQIRQGPPPSPYGFLGSYGRFFDPQTSLYLLGARLYDPTLGRFLSRDPIPGGSANDYEYGAGNPVMNADPSGRFYGIASMCYLIVMGGGYDPMCAEAPPPTDPEPRVGGGSRMGDKLIYKDPMSGTYMIIDTRRGVIEARDLGRTAVVRKLWSKPSIEWSSVGKSFAEEIPFWGIYYKGHRCNYEQRGQYGCNVSAFLSVGTREAGLVAPNPYSAIFTVGGMVVNPLMDVAGQFVGGARW